MFEKVNPNHPDKVADRIAGAIVDYAYFKNSNYLTLIPAIADIYNNPKIAVEVLIGHNVCTIIAETSVELKYNDICNIVERIAGNQQVNLIQVPQDEHLASNQENGIKCGDNGIFKGVLINQEEKDLTEIAKANYTAFKSDGKYIIDKSKIIVCQSNAGYEEIEKLTRYYMKPSDARALIINPLGYWTGGTNVDTGATNRKLGSDMGRAVTGGGLHGKDLSKCDVSINIYLHKKAQETGQTCECSCAIGDTNVLVKTNMKGIYTQIVMYSEIVDVARNYICAIGGFEKLAEWGLLR